MSLCVLSCNLAYMKYRRTRKNFKTKIIFEEKKVERLIVSEHRISNYNDDYIFRFARRK